MAAILTLTDAIKTTGPWMNEDQAKDALDEEVEKTGLFNIYREVPGYYVQRRLHQEEKEPRIDRILSPRPKLLDLRWPHGPIGIEVKVPGTKIGPVVAQMLDYSRAIWTVKGFNFYLSWTFLWHLEKQTSTIGSILAQHRLGTAYLHRPESPWGGLFFYSGDLHFLRCRWSGEVELGEASNGRRAGSR
jgi:hypothetical protein